MSWISGPCNDEPRRDDEQGEPAIVDTGTHWDVEMADSGTHWVRLEWNPGHFEPSRGRVEDAE
jgi:hypothetical protein